MDVNILSQAFELSFIRSANSATKPVEVGSQILLSNCLWMSQTARVFSCLFSTDGSLFQDYESRKGKMIPGDINLFAIPLVPCLKRVLILECVCVFTVCEAVERTL